MDKVLTWMVLARVEDSDSMFANDPITAEKLSIMAENYDPALRLAPAISGYDQAAGLAGPSHFTGEWSPPLGFARALEFDGLNLWGLVEELIGEDGEPMISSLVARGFWQRSIGWWNDLPDLGKRQKKGKRAYLRHIAILGGEPPGIPNLPPLTEYFMQSSGDPMTGRVLAGLPCFTRSISNTPRSAIQPAPAVPQEVSMTPEEIRAIVAQETRGALGTAIGEGLRTALPEVLKPLQEELRTAMTNAQAAVAAATAATEATNATRAALDAQLKSLRTAEVSRRFETLVRSGRLTPADRAEEEQFLQGLDDARVDQRLAQLEARSAIDPRRLSAPAALDVRVGEETVTVNTRAYTVPVAGAPIDEQAIQSVAELKARHGDDPKKLRAALLASVGERPVVEV